MAQPGGYSYPMQQCYFTLDDNIPARATRTCGDPIRAHIHLNPFKEETLSISHLQVHFRCKVRTLITTGSGNNRRLHKCKVFLFSFTTMIQRQMISINSHQSWPVSFDFPWSVLPHPTQNTFLPSRIFPHQPGHRLPPSFGRDVRGHVQSVRYYMEAIMNRQGRVIDHTDKKILEFNFVPPLDIPNPPPLIKPGMRASLIRSSRLLDPEKAKEHYGFREKTKHLFSSENDPTAVFSLSASAPTVCCLGDALPITLHMTYNAQTSTAPVQPEVKLKSIHIRVGDFVQYRVPYTSLFSSSDLVRDSEQKFDLVRRGFTQSPVVHDGMNLGEIVEVKLGGTGISCSFATFSINRGFMLKISGVFECAGKTFDLVLYRHPITIHPPRALFRELPVGMATPQPPVQQIAPPNEETLPPYVPGSSSNKPAPPSYEETKSKS